MDFYGLDLKELKSNCKQLMSNVNVIIVSNVN